MIYFNEYNGVDLLIDNLELNTEISIKYINIKIIFWNLICLN